MAAAVERVTREHGRVDILVNNAGILPEATAAEADQPLDLDLFNRTFSTNVLGAVAVTQAFLPLLRASDAGRIVNVSSTMGSLSDQVNPESPYYGLVVPAYQTSKAALNGLTIALSKALAGSAIKVNSVCPGWVQTDLGGPDNRAAAPTSADEAAHVVVRAALLGPAGPSGTFFDDAGTGRLVAPATPEPPQHCWGGSGASRGDRGGAGGNRTRVLERRTRSSPGAVNDDVFSAPALALTRCRRAQSGKSPGHSS